MAVCWRVGLLARTYKQPQKIIECRTLKTSTKPTCNIQRVTNCMSDLNEQMIINSTAPFLFCAVAKIAKQND